MPDCNLRLYARCIAVQDKLRADQITHVEEFSDRTPAERLIHLFSKLHALENKIDAIRIAQPEYQVTRETEVSICYYFDHSVVQLNLTMYSRPILRDRVLASFVLARP
jgi:hypothetical protein